MPSCKDTESLCQRVQGLDFWVHKHILQTVWLQHCSSRAQEQETQRAIPRVLSPYRVSLPALQNSTNTASTDTAWDQMNLWISPESEKGKGEDTWGEDMATLKCKGGVGRRMCSEHQSWDSPASPAEGYNTANCFPVIHKGHGGYSIHPQPTRRRYSCSIQSVSAHIFISPYHLVLPELLERNPNWSIKTNQVCVHDVTIKTYK